MHRSLDRGSTTGIVTYALIPVQSMQLRRDILSDHISECLM